MILTDDMRLKINRGEKTRVGISDISKNFKTVQREMFLDKLENHGFRIKSLGFCKDIYDAETKHSIS